MLELGLALGGIAIGLLCWFSDKLGIVLSKPVLVIGMALAIALLLFSAILLFVHSREPKNTGVLQFPAGSGGFRYVQIGPGGATFAIGREDNNPQLQQTLGLMFKAFNLKTVLRDGQLMVSATIRDRDSGNIIAELIDNEFKVAPNAWDRNYTKSALEVRRADGVVVLQVHWIPAPTGDKPHLQFQGESWDADGTGERMVVVRSDNDGKLNSLLRLMNRKVYSPRPVIQQMFRYPSDGHLGELLDEPLTPDLESAQTWPKGPPYGIMFPPGYYRLGDP